MSQFVIELRAEVTENTLVGHAATFETMADVGPHYERMAPTAFDEALKDSDIKAFYSHDASKPLGSTAAGNLRLSVDKRGLAFELDLPDVSWAQDVKALVRSGILTGVSFGFIPGSDSWSRAQDGRQIRTHESVKRLIEISPVALPAYQGTDIQLRSLSDFKFETPVETINPRIVMARARLALV